MSADRYHPERDIMPQFLATVFRSLEPAGELFVMLRYLRAAGAKDYAFIDKPDAFRRLIDLCPTGTDIIVFKDRQLPFRGRVDDDFIRDVQTQIADGTEYLCVCMSLETPGDPRLSGDLGDSHGDLLEDLADLQGEFVAIGACPPFTDADNDAMISASKGGIDGPR